MTTAKETLEIIAHDVAQIDLDHTGAIHQLANLANRLIALQDKVGNELFNAEEGE